MAEREGPYSRRRGRSVLIRYRTANDGRRPEIARSYPQSLSRTLWMKHPYIDGTPLPLVIPLSSVCPIHYFTIAAVDVLDLFEPKWSSSDKRRIRECNIPPLMKVLLLSFSPDIQRIIWVRLRLMIMLYTTVPTDPNYCTYIAVSGSVSCCQRPSPYHRHFRNLYLTIRWWDQSAYASRLLIYLHRLMIIHHMSHMLAMLLLMKMAMMMATSFIPIVWPSTLYMFLGQGWSGWTWCSFRMDVSLYNAEARRAYFVYALFSQTL